MTEPGTDPLYVKRAPAKLGDPYTDPPLTLRVHPDDDPRSRGARRVVRADTGSMYSWGAVTGDPLCRPLTNDDVRTWPVTHWLVAVTPYRHAAAADAREAGGADALAGDDLAGPGTNLFR